MTDPTTCSVVFTDGTPCMGEGVYRARIGTGRWCRPCYDWSRKNGWADPTARVPRQPARLAPCTADGCDNWDFLRRGWCSDCYMWSYRNNWADPATRPEPIRYDVCTVVFDDGTPCPRPHHAHGRCRPCNRWSKRNGGADPNGRRSGNFTRLPELEAAAQATTEDCIIYGDGTRRPYVKFMGHTTPASRAVWTIANGDPGDLHVLHICNGGSGDHGCINIQHLYPGTHAQNMRDRNEAGRSGKGRANTRGERHGMSTLSESQVREIRRRYVPGRGAHRGNSSALAAEFGVTRTAVTLAATRRSWRWLDD